MLSVTPKTQKRVCLNMLKRKDMFKEVLNNNICIRLKHVWSVLNNCFGYTGYFRYKPFHNSLPTFSVHWNSVKNYEMGFRDFTWRRTAACVSHSSRPSPVPSPSTGSRSYARAACSHPRESNQSINCNSYKLEQILCTYMPHTNILEKYFFQLFHHSCSRYHAHAAC